MVEDSDSDGNPLERAFSRWATLLEVRERTMKMMEEEYFVLRGSTLKVAIASALLSGGTSARRLLDALYKEEGVLYEICADVLAEHPHGLDFASFEEVCSLGTDAVSPPVPGCCSAGPIGLW